MVAIVSVADAMVRGNGKEAGELFAGCTEAMALLGLAADILGPAPGRQAPLVVADSEHFTAGLLDHVAADPAFDLLVPAAKREMERRLSPISYADMQITPSRLASSAVGAACLVFGGIDAQLPEVRPGP